MADSKSYIQVLGEYLRGRIDAQLATELGLVNVMYGSLRQVFYMEAEGAEGLVNEVPSVFVLPATSDVVITTVNAQRWTEDVVFRIVYVDKIAEGTTHDANRTRAQRIRDILIENPRFQTPAIAFTSANAQILSIKRISIDFYPIEDAYVSSVNAQFLADALTVSLGVLLTNVST